jgi:cation:H+ antiporter
MTEPTSPDQVQSPESSAGNGAWPPSQRVVRLAGAVTFGLGGIIAIGSLWVDTVSLIYLVIGFVLLLGGAEFLVRGASTLAVRLGVGPLIVGLTVVAFGTSAPELFVGIAAVIEGKSDFNVGNIVGSNIANIGLILGATAVTCPFACSGQALRREVPIMIFVTLLAIGACYGGVLQRWEGLVGIALLGLYLWRSFRLARVGLYEPDMPDEIEAKPGMGALAWVVPLVSIGGGLLALIGGSNLLITAGSDIAERFHVPEIVIGLTIVAIGTSLPELATCVVAALRNQPEIVVGNVIGSNLFNLLFVLGITSAIRPISIPPVTNAVDVWVMLGFAIALPLVSVVGGRITRVEGGILLLAYLIYTGIRYTL